MKVILICNVDLLSTILFSNVQINVQLTNAQLIQWPVSTLQFETESGITRQIHFQVAQFAPQLQTDSDAPIRFQLFAPVSTDSNSAQLGCDTMTKPTNTNNSFAIMVSRGICDIGTKLFQIEFRATTKQI
jgi:hypothetical protein